MKRKNSKQPIINYSFNIFVAEITQLTKGTKRKKAMTSVAYKRVNSSKKGYKNLEWLNRMYKKKIDSMEHLDPSDREKYYKVILPTTNLPNNYKLYDENEEYYATIIAQDEIFYYIVVKKDETATPFLKELVEKLLIKGQCQEKYGMKIPLEFYKDHERKD